MYAAQKKKSQEVQGNEHEEWPNEEDYTEQNQRKERQADQEDEDAKNGGPERQVVIMDSVC